MYRFVPRLMAMLVSLIALSLGSTPGAVANPQDYPQFAQQKVDESIPINFEHSESVKQRLDTGAPQLIVDVRKLSSYEKAHLPGAVSIPLEELPYRAAEIPRDIPVVLY
jgi:hypothetical protein